MDHDVQSKVLTSHSFMRLTHKALKERGLPNLSQLSKSRREVGSSERELLNRVNELKKGAIKLDTMEQFYKWSRLSGWTQMLFLVHMQTGTEREELDMFLNAMLAMKDHSALVRSWSVHKMQEMQLEGGRRTATMSEEMETDAEETARLFRQDEESLRSVTVECSEQAKRDSSRHFDDTCRALIGSLLPCEKRLVTQQIKEKKMRTLCGHRRSFEETVHFVQCAVKLTQLMEQLKAKQSVPTRHSLKRDMLRRLEQAKRQATTMDMVLDSCNLVAFRTGPNQELALWRSFTSITQFRSNLKGEIEKAFNMVESACSSRSNTSSSSSGSNDLEEKKEKTKKKKKKKKKTDGKRHENLSSYVARIAQSMIDHSARGDYDAGSSEIREHCMTHARFVAHTVLSQTSKQNPESPTQSDTRRRTRTRSSSADAGPRNKRNKIDE